MADRVATTRETTGPLTVAGHGEERVDVLVVGAGPAGCLTARLLAGSDLRIVVLDARPAPIVRPCGEFLSPDGLRILAAAGLEDAVLATGAVPLTGLDLCAPSGCISSDYHAVAGHAPFRPHGLGLRRERFDTVLQAGAAAVADLRRGWRCHAIAAEGASGWTVTCGTPEGPRRLHCRLLVGADGRRSRIRLQAGLDRPCRRRRYALMCRATGIPHGRHGEMHLGLLGQVGLAPIGAGAVTLNLLLAETSAPLRQRLDRAQLLRLALAGTPSLAGRCRQARLGPVLATGSLPAAARRVAVPGLALVGDAAGFCDPFTGEGICSALQGAELLAAAIAATPHEELSGADLATRYHRAHRRRFAGRQLLGSVLPAILRRRGLAQGLIAALGWHQGASRLLVALTGDYLESPPSPRPRTSISTTARELAGMATAQIHGPHQPPSTSATATRL